MQRNSKTTAVIILGVIGIGISVGMSIFYIIQYIPIHILIVIHEYLTIKTVDWIRFIIILVFPLLGGIQATIGLFRKKQSILRRSTIIITASMGLVTAQIIVSSSYFWEFFRYASNYRLFSIFLAIGTAIALFSFLGSGLLLLSMNENYEPRPMTLEGSRGIWMVGIGVILSILSSSCIVAGIHREKQPNVNNFLSFGELNFLGLLGALTFMGVFVTIYGMFLSRKKPNIGVIVILLGSIWLQVYQNVFVLGFWDPDGSYLYYIEYMHLLEILSIIQLVFIIAGIVVILSYNYQPQIKKREPWLLYFYFGLDILVILFAILFLL